MNTQVTLEGKKLKEIAHASHSAEVTMTNLALRERLRHFSDINRTKNKLIRSGEKIVDAEYNKLWKDLQSAGVGSIIYGRRGKPDRFEWHYSLKAVAQAALEGHDVKTERLGSEVMPAPIAPKQSRSKPSVADKTQKADKKGPGEKLVVFPLRKNYTLQFNLPADLSKEEAELLAETIKRLV